MDFQVRSIIWVRREIYGFPSVNVQIRQNHKTLYNAGHAETSMIPNESPTAHQVDQLMLCVGACAQLPFVLMVEVNTLFTSHRKC